MEGHFLADQNSINEIDTSISCSRSGVQSAFRIMLTEPSNSDGDQDGSDYDDDLVTIQDVARIMKNSEKLFNQKEYSAAASFLSKALAVLSEEYGEGAPECADALFYYGRALYYNVIDMVGILGSSAAKYGIDTNSVRDQDDINEDSTSYYVKGKSKAIPDNAGQDVQGEEDQKEEQTTADEDLELAYQVLSLSIKAYSANTEENDLKMGDAYLYLGHVHLECERPVEASESFKNALEIKLRHFKPGNNEITEAYYIYGVALQASEEYNLALENVKKARENIMIRIPSVENISSDSEEEKTKAKIELEQLNEYLKEIDSKIEDLVYTIRFCKDGDYSSLMKHYGLSGKKDSAQIQGANKSQPFKGTNISALDIKDVSGLIKKTVSTSSDIKGVKVAPEKRSYQDEPPLPNKKVRN